MRSKTRMLFCGLLIGCYASITSPARAQDSDLPVTRADSVQTAKKHLYFGNNYYKNGAYGDAETQLLKAWAYNSSSASTARYLARTYNKAEKYDEAISWYKKAIELAPTGQYTKGAYSDLATIYVYQQNTEGAIASYEALLGFDLEQDEEIKYLYSLVQLCIDSEDLEKALGYSQRWGELAPDDPKVREMIGKLHMRTGGEDEALEQMEKVLEMTPDDQGTRESLAALYFKRGELDKAFTLYEALHAHNPTSLLYLERLTNLSRQLGKSKSQITELLKLMYKMQPDNLSVIEQLADATGNMKWVELGLKKDPRNGKYPYMMGDYYFDKFQKDSSGKQDSIRALDWFNKAQADPQWKGNARAMIQTLDPPLSEEEKKRREFFEKSKEKKEEVKQVGKK